MTIVALVWRCSRDLAGNLRTLGGLGAHTVSVAEFLMGRHYLGLGPRELRPSLKNVRCQISMPVTAAR